VAENDFNLLPLLDYINPATVDYQTWVNVGMALKHEGYTASDWDNWSQNDSRYKKFECFKKWDTFNEEAGTIVTGATITQLAKEFDYTKYQRISFENLVISDYKYDNGFTWSFEEELYSYMTEDGEKLYVLLQLFRRAIHKRQYCFLWIVLFILSNKRFLFIL